MVARSCNGGRNHCGECEQCGDFWEYEGWDNGRWYKVYICGTKPKICMLIFHGANDVRCKIAESDAIVAAMRAKDIPVTYVVYPDEGHGFQKPPNRLSYVAIAEAFFAHHLGGACEPVGHDFDGSSHEFRAGAKIFLEIASPQS